MASDLANMMIFCRTAIVIVKMETLCSRLSDSDHGTLSQWDKILHLSWYYDGSLRFLIYLIFHEIGNGCYLVSYPFTVYFKVVP